MPVPSSTPPRTLPAPNSDELSELLLNARFGELEELQTFVDTFGSEWVWKARDERTGNGALHYCCGNGHVEILSHLLSLPPPPTSTPPSSPAPLPPLSHLSPLNNLSSSPLHWATLNGHLPILRLLCPQLSQREISLPMGGAVGGEESQSGKTKNGSNNGRTALGVAEEKAEQAKEGLMTGLGKGKNDGGSAVGGEDGEGEGEDEKKRWEEIVGYLLGFLEIGSKKGEGDDETNKESGEKGGADVVDEEEVTKRKMEEMTLNGDGTTEMSKSEKVRS